MTLVRSQRFSIALFLLVLPGLVGPVAAEPVVTIASNGDPANRLDIVFVGDGYTAAQMPVFANDVQTIIDRMFLQEPLRFYRRYCNLRRIEVESAESGVDHPERQPPVLRNTALNGSYNCGGIQRLICVDSARLTAVLQRSLPASQRDLVMVIVNDPEYGGAGGSYLTVSTHPDTVEVALHEMGHTLGLLADEYGGNSGPSCRPNTEPPEPNVTKETTRDNIKWNHWLQSFTALPSNDTLRGVPGLYEGAKYCDRGLFRPTYNSKMRSLGVPFDAINTEQLIRRIYNRVSPIDSAEPQLRSLSIPKGQSQLFSVTTPVPFPQRLNVEWFVDGTSRGTDFSFTLDTGSLSLGSHKVDVVVKDLTILVRRDPTGLLIERESWTVNVVSP